MKILTHLLCLCCLSISNNLSCGINEAFVYRRLSSPPRLLTWQEAPEDGWHAAEQEAILLATVFRQDPKRKAARETLFLKHHTSAPAAYELAKLVLEGWCTEDDFVVSFEKLPMLLINPYLYFLQEAAYKTYLPAIYELGLYHINSENIDSVLTEGLCLLKRAAQMGMHEAAIVVCEHFSIVTRRFVTKYITAACRDGDNESNIVSTLDAISFRANLKPRYILNLLTSLEEELPDSEVIQEAFEQLKSRAREILEPLS